jgi:hypothetical protein
MSETRPAFHDPATALIGETRELSAGLIAFVFNQLRDLPVATLTPALLRNFLRTVIKPCEALVRRAIWLLAARMKPVARPAARPRPGAPPPAPPAAAAPRVPAFRLTEPTGSARRQAQPPRAAGPKPSVSPDRFNQRFVMRLAALRNACADPDRCAVRLLRRLARTRPAARPLKPSPPPGITAARTERIKSLFADLDAATQAAWPRLANTS